jgi:hypothetical protein
MPAEPGTIVKACPWPWRIANAVMSVFLAMATYVQVHCIIDASSSSSSSSSL